jgi:hypothetical protein
MARQREVDWDTRLVTQLRRSSPDPFRPYEIDFFLGMPGDAAAGAVAGQLRAEGFAVDVKAVPDSVAHPFSVHAMKQMPLSVDEIRATSTRLRSIAAAQGGRYDGWAAAGAGAAAAGGGSADAP